MSRNLDPEMIQLRAPNGKLIVRTSQIAVGTCDVLGWYEDNGELLVSEDDDAGVDQGDWETQYDSEKGARVIDEGGEEWWETECSRVTPEEYAAQVEAEEIEAEEARLAAAQAALRQRKAGRR